MKTITEFIYENSPYLLGFSIVLGTVASILGFSTGQTITAGILLLLSVGVGYLYR